jgi:hypothetical protein
MRKALNVTVKILRNRVTYRFLAGLLAALGVATATNTVDRVETILCAILGGCY